MKFETRQMLVLLSSSFHVLNPRKIKIKGYQFPSPVMSWTCKKCTFLNPPSQKSECQICLSSPSPLLPSTSSSSSSPPKWSCKACTFLNPYNNSACDVCDTRCPVPSLSNLDDFNDADHDSSVGSVFFPLRSCKRKAIDPIHVVDDDSAEAPVVKASENIDLGKASSSLKILSYNVWFREDLELQKRMKAIGDLVQLHSPDVICFQLSKLPVKSFSTKPFSNSIMGRELCIAEVEAGSGKSLVVATSHLESPCPAPPKWDQMFSKERVEQANEALNLLKKHPNVVFGGDMNWDDKLDGQYPLLQDGWIDAWSQLRPNESGWTYDTKSNQMLTGNRTLQKRLDRFICRFGDLQISSIDMVGMDAIPGVLYNKEKKVRKEIKHLELPVLPSDHYGLLLTISSK